MKDSIKQMIQSKLDEKVKFYNEKMRSLEATENVPDIFYLITETFGNSMEQKNALIVLMESKFTSEFFKRAKVNKKTNEIEIIDGTYAVYFPTSFIRSVKIKRVDEVKITMMKPNLGARGYNSEFAIAYSDYKENPSQENGATLKQVFLDDVLKTKRKLFGKTPSLDELMPKIEQFQNSAIAEAYEYNDKLTTWKANKEKLDSAEMNDFKFLEDIKQDLEQFKNSESWSIKAEGLHKKALKFSFMEQE